MHALGRTLGLAAGLFSLATLAAGADGSWTRCAAPARLVADPAGRAFHVATWGTNPGSCPAPGYTFRTIDAAAKCAKGKDTIYVHAGTYGPVLIANLWPSDRVLITNASGENPIIDGWNGVADYAAILGLWQVSNFAIQGLEIRNTGVPDAEHGGYGVRVSRSSSVKLYFNTVHDTARHGIITDGSQMEIVGNEVYNAVMRNRWWQSSFWDAAVSSDPTRSQWGFTLRGNSIHDSWGECADVLAVDGATVEGNRIYNCVSANLFVSGSRNVTVNRNWIYEASDQYNRPDLGYRAAGLELANEGAAAGWSVSDIRITNNIVEWVAQGIRYWRSRTGGSVWDGYGDLYVGFNNFNRTQFSPLRFDTPDGGWPSAQSRLRQNLVLNQSGWAWFSTDTSGAWTVAGNWNYGKSTTSTNPGIVDTWGSYIPAYDLRSGAVIRWTVAPWSEPEMPSADYHCQSRGQNDWNTPGAVN